MLEKDKLRKADVFSGALVFLFGLWVVGQAVQMPMRDSWGGVMNVWYVSPALMPLSIGGVITLLGAILCRIGLKATGLAAFKDNLRWLASAEMVALLKSEATCGFTPSSPFSSRWSTSTCPGSIFFFALFCS